MLQGCRGQVEKLADRQNWSAGYNTWLLIRLTPNGVLLSFHLNHREPDAAARHCLHLVFVQTMINMQLALPSDTRLRTC